MISHTIFVQVDSLIADYPICTAPKGTLMTSVEIAMLILVPTLVCCAIALTYYCYKTMNHNKRGLHHHLQHGDDSIEAPDHPILSKNVSLRRMIEMTTSGSGSGKFFVIVVFIVVQDL